MHVQTTPFDHGRVIEEDDERRSDEAEGCEHGRVPRPKEGRTWSEGPGPVVPTSTWRLFAVGGEARLAAAAGRLRAEAGRLRVAGPPRKRPLSERATFAGGSAAMPEAGLLRTLATGAGQALAAVRERLASRERAVKAAGRLRAAGRRPQAGGPGDTGDTGVEGGTACLPRRR